MKGPFMRTVLLAALLIPAVGAWAEGFAFVNMEAVFQGYYKTSRSDATFKKQKDVYTEHAQNLAAEADAIRKQRDEHQERALNIAFSDEARTQNRRQAEEKNGLFEEKKRELQQFMTRTENELQQKYLELRGELVKEIADFIGTLGRRDGYEMVVDTSGLTRNMLPVVIYFNAARDITEAVLTELNRGHEEEAAAAAAARTAEAAKAAEAGKGE